MLKRLESERPKIQADIQAGKRLQKDRNAPAFVSKSVEDLDRKWKDTNEKAKQKHEKLKVSFSLHLHIPSITVEPLHTNTKGTFR